MNTGKTDADTCSLKRPLTQKNRRFNGHQRRNGPAAYQGAGLGEVDHLAWAGPLTERFSAPVWAVAVAASLLPDGVVSPCPKNPHRNDHSDSHPLKTTHDDLLIVGQ
jgi:hypothetical protein